MPLVVSDEMLKAPAPHLGEKEAGAGRAGAAEAYYQVPAAVLKRTLAEESRRGTVGLAMTVFCVAVGALAVLIGIATPGGVIKIALTSEQVIELSGVPSGLVLVLAGLAFYVLSRPAVKRE